jgi:uncharacterized membrane protein
MAEQELEDLKGRVRQIEEVLTYLVDHVDSIDRKTAPAPTKPAGESPIGSAQTDSSSADEQTSHAYSSSPSQQMHRPPRPQPQTRPMPSSRAASSAQVLGFVAAICFVFAGAYIVKLALDLNWLTPLRQVALGTVFGLTLIGAGFGLRLKDRQFASLLPAAGVLVLMSALLGAHSIYKLLDTPVAVFGSLGLSAVTIWLYRRFEATAYLFLAPLGAYFVPSIALAVADANADFTAAYLMAVSLAYGTLSVWSGSRALTLIGAYCAIGVSSAWNLHFNQPQLFLFLILGHFVVFVVAILMQTWELGRPLTRNEAVSYFPVVLFFYAIEYSLLRDLIPGWVDWIAIAFAIGLNGLYFAGRELVSKSSALASRDVIHGLSLIILFHALYLNLLPDEGRPALMLALLAVIAFLPNFSIATPMKREDLALTVRIGAFMAFAILLVGLLSVFFNLLKAQDPLWVGYGLTAAALLFAMHVRERSDLVPGYQLNALILGTAHLQAVAAFYNVTQNIGSLAVSAAWCLYACAVLFVGFMRRDRLFAQSSIAVLVIAAGKALLYDTSAASPGVRILCLILTGAVLYGAGFLFRKIERWDTKTAG